MSCHIHAPLQAECHRMASSSLGTFCLPHSGWAISRGPGLSPSQQAALICCGYRKFRSSVCSTGKQWFWTRMLVSDARFSFALAGINEKANRTVELFSGLWKCCLYSGTLSSPDISHSACGVSFWPQCWKHLPVSCISKYFHANWWKPRGKSARLPAFVFGPWELQECLNQGLWWRRQREMGKTHRIIAPVNTPRESLSGAQEGLDCKGTNYPGFWTPLEAGWKMRDPSLRIKDCQVVLQQ